MSKNVIEECWSRFSTKNMRFCSVILNTSVAGLSLPEIASLENTALHSLLPNALMEWEVVVTRDKEGECICSAHITQQHIIVNKLNKNVLAIGSECIKKYGSDSHKRYLSIFSGAKKYTGSKSACCFCGAHRVSNPTSIPICKSCREGGRSQPSSEYLAAVGERCKTCSRGKIVPGSLILSCRDCTTTKCGLCSNLFAPTSSQATYCPYCVIVLQSWRICIICRRANIQASEETWKIKCVECFRNTKPQPPKVITEWRSCEVCQQEKIPASEPSYKTMCAPCYSKTKTRERETSEREMSKQRERICVDCKKTKIDPSEPSYKTTCVTCYRKRSNAEPSVMLRFCTKCNTCLPTDHPANRQMCSRCWRYKSSSSPTKASTLVVLVI